MTFDDRGGGGCIDSGLSAIIRDDRLDLIQPIVSSARSCVCTVCTQWPDQPMQSAALRFKREALQLLLYSGLFKYLQIRYL
jgi:hypothetical protein